MADFAQSKTEYLENVSGHRIVQRQDEINSQPNTWVKATQIFALHKDFDGHPFKIEREGKVHRVYDAFIYYGKKLLEEEKPTSQQTDEIKQDNPTIPVNSKIDIIIPQ